MTVPSPAEKAASERLAEGPISSRAVTDAAAFAAWSAIEAGQWDEHLSSLTRAINRRKEIYNHKRQPSRKLPTGQVWVWMQGENPPRWEIRGTGALLDSPGWGEECATCGVKPRREDDIFCSDNCKTADWAIVGGEPDPNEQYDREGLFRRG